MRTFLMNVTLWYLQYIMEIICLSDCLEQSVLFISQDTKKVIFLVKDSPQKRLEIK